MERFRMQRRVQIEVPKFDPPKYDDESEEGRLPFRASNSNVSDDQEPFMGIKVRRKASLHRDYKGDYLDVPSHPFLMKILHKQGDKQVLFADKVLKFTGSGKIKRCVMLITDFAMYIVDPEVDALKRRIALAAVEKIFLSELNDNFFALIIPTEYDLLMASTRKTEIVTVLVEATKSASDFELEVVFSNRFEYNAASDMVKEIQFEEVKGMWQKKKFLLKLKALFFLLTGIGSFEDGDYRQSTHFYFSGKEYFLPHFSEDSFFGLNKFQEVSKQEFRGSELLFTIL